MQITDSHHEKMANQANRASWRPDTRHGTMPEYLHAPPSGYILCKLVADMTAAVVILILTLPLLLLTALLVKLTSRGPVIYSQMRLGRHGKPFFIYKIRTMRHNCESLTGPKWSTAGDDRIIWIGRFLRRTHIDELPQLWNVLRGDMSLVGPRPERPEFVSGLEKVLPLYRQRLQVRPGISGLAQVQLLPDTDVSSVRRKLAHDLFYIHSLSFWLDLRILIATAFGLLFFPVGVSRFLLGLPGGQHVEQAYEKHPAVIKIDLELEIA